MTHATARLWAPLPHTQLSCSTMSVRLRTQSMRLLVKAVEDRLRELPIRSALLRPVRELDSKPLVVSK